MVLPASALLPKSALRLISLGTIFILVGCGGPANIPSTPPQGPNGVLFISPPPKSLAVNASATLTAAATYPLSASGSNTQVTWSVSCGTPNECGTFSPNADVSGITYTAPANIPAGKTVTVTATSVVDTTKFASTKITIVPPIPISVSFFATPPAMLLVNATFSLSAAINNDVSANPQVKWTVACGGSACGSFNPTSTGDEVPTTYTAPATIPSRGSVIVTATSITDPTKSVSANILISAAAPTLANGTYVFQLSGGVGTEASFITGVFTANGGVITGGEQDSIDYTSDSDDNWYGYASSQQISGGSYGTTFDGNVQVSLQLGPYETETLNGTLAAGGNGFVAGLNGSPASGTLDLQTSTTAPSGGYALTLFGGDEFTNAAWIGGILNIDSTGKISGAGSILDVNDGETGFGGTQSLGVSTVSAPDANGRVQIQLFPGASSTLPPLYLAGYIVDATHIRLIETGDANDTTNFQGVLGGTALGQSAATGHFSAAAIAGATYVFGAQGDDAHGSLQIAGVLSPKSDGSVTGLLNWNDLTGSMSQNPIAFSGTYTVDPTGRVTVSSATDGSTFNYSFHLYLTGDGNGLLLSNDSNDTFIGQAFQQQTTPFTAASFSGSYGLNATAFIANSGNGALQATPVNGQIAANAGSDTCTVTGFADTGNEAADFLISGSFTPNANGIFEGILAGFNPASRATSGNFALYLIDSTQGMLIETDNAQLVLGHMEH